MEYLRDLVYKFAHVTNKADPKSLKLTKIAAYRKFIVFNGVDTSTVSAESHEAFPANYAHLDSVNLERNRRKQSNMFINLTYIFGKDCKSGKRCVFGMGEKGVLHIKEFTRLQ